MSRRRRTTAAGLTIGFAMALVVTLATTWIGITALRVVASTTNAVAHTYATKAALAQVLATLVDAETGQRGFVITGDDQYLQIYEAGRSAMPAMLAQARDMISSAPEQQQDLARISALAGTKLEELAEVIQLRREHGFADAQSMVARNAGKRTMDAIRGIAANMAAREDIVLSERIANATRSYRAALWALGSAAGLGALSVIGLFVATLRFARDRDHATRALEAKQMELREAMQLKDEFVAVISHELRTPTNTIAGWARMLEERTVRPERVENAIAAIARNTESLRQLVDDLMDTTQLIAGRLRLVVDAINVREVVLDAIDTVRLSADNKGVVLNGPADAVEPIVIQGDAARLKQIVWNVLSNAIKFTPAGGHVDVRLTTADSAVRIEISDTGAGIDGGFLPFVFDRFRQGGVMEGRRGVGLGLAIVRHLVELHGGTVTAHSAGPGTGATFAIDLPVLGAEAVAAEASWTHQ